MVVSKRYGCGASDTPDTAPVERTPRVGGEKVDIPATSNHAFTGNLTSATSNILATREEYIDLMRKSIDNKKKIGHS